MVAEKHPLIGRVVIGPVAEPIRRGPVASVEGKDLRGEKSAVEPVHEDIEAGGCGDDPERIHLFGWVDDPDDNGNGKGRGEGKDYP